MALSIGGFLTDLIGKNGLLDLPMGGGLRKLSLLQASLILFE